jgi:hypothetical protein
VANRFEKSDIPSVEETRWRLLRFVHTCDYGPGATEDTSNARRMSAWASSGIAQQGSGFRYVTQTPGGSGNVNRLSGGPGPGLGSPLG